MIERCLLQLSDGTFEHLNSRTEFQTLLFHLFFDSLNLWLVKTVGLKKIYRVLDEDFSWTAPIECRQDGPD